LDGDHGWTREGMVTAREVRELLSEHWRLVPDDVPRGGAPAELWQVLPREAAPADGSGTSDGVDPDTAEPATADPPQPLGRVGVIASVTEPFCSACTRTRITADGKVRSCLFSHEEFDLASAMRSGEADEVVARLWQQAMWLKPAAHGLEPPGLDRGDYVQPDRTMRARGGWQAALDDEETRMSPAHAADRSLQVRYFAAARAAAGGIAEESVPLPARIDALTREQLAALLVSLHPDPPADEPSLERVLEQ